MVAETAFNGNPVGAGDHAERVDRCRGWQVTALSQTVAEVLSLCFLDISVKASVASYRKRLVGH
jgi:hypothetical protein